MNKQVLSEHGQICIPQAILLNQAVCISVQKVPTSLRLTHSVTPKMNSLKVQNYI